MAADNRRYSANGAAAYDVYSGAYAYNERYDGSALRRPERQHLPEERPVPRRQERVKVKTAVEPFTLFGMAAAALMLVLVIFGYVQLFEATTKVGALESQLKTLTQQQTLLESKYESKIDLKVVRERAEKLGMSMPKEEQVVYIRLAGTDRAEIYEEEKTNIVGEIVQAVQESISNLIAYLRPTAA